MALFEEGPLGRKQLSILPPQGPEVPLNGYRVVIVDDDPLIREPFRQYLENLGYRVTTADSVDAALVVLSSGLPDLVISDLLMPGRNGLELLAEIQSRYSGLPVIMMTGQGSVEGAVTAIRSGASDYLLKPFSFEALLFAVERILKQQETRHELHQLRGELDKNYGFEQIITQNKTMQDKFTMLRRIADSDSTVLIEGDTGSGKELVAHAIHRNSRRKDRQFYRVNCATFAESLLESELFGHEKGAFTGAMATRKGIFEQADGGTLLLDELENLSVAMQMKLLRVLELGEFQRVGGRETIKVDFRLIGTSNRSLLKMVESGEFRRDLFYRIAVITVSLPPLRERKDDIPLLIHHFAKEVASKLGGRTIPRIDPSAMDALVRYSWPGNVRELRNVVERTMVAATSSTITVRDLPDEVLSAAPATVDFVKGFAGQSVTLDQLKQRVYDEVERRYIETALQNANGHVSKCAIQLGVSRRTLYSKMQRFGFSIRDFKN